MVAVAGVPLLSSGGLPPSEPIAPRPPIEIVSVVTCPASALARTRTKNEREHEEPMIDFPLDVSVTAGRLCDRADRRAPARGALARSDASSDSPHEKPRFCQRAKPGAPFMEPSADTCTSR